MENPKLSELIRAGYSRPSREDTADLESALLSRARLILLIPGARRSRRRRDALLLELIGLYRTGPRQVWGPLLLEVMGPAICERLEGYQALGPVLADEDIAQQLVVEVLEAALSIPLALGAQWIEERLINRATKRIWRRFQRELRHLDWHTPLLEIGDEGVPETWD